MGQIQDRIRQDVEGWAGITSGPHQFGAIEFLLGETEIGHLHGDRLLDIAYSKPVRDALIAEGQVIKHHVLPESGWTSFHIRSNEDVEHALWLLRLSYVRHVILLKRKRNRTADPVADLDIGAELAALNLSDTLRATFDALLTRNNS